MNKILHLYVHIPFCNSLCSYCDFKRDLKQKYDINKYVQKIIQQVNLECESFYKTIYVGGGTPNCLPDNILEDLLTELSSHLALNGEFTVECNPELITDSQIKIFKKCHINRISLGVQSVNNKILKLMGRNHSINNIENSIKLLHKYKINNISCDFIYGYNEMEIVDLKKDFDFIEKYQINHVSFYALELKENSFITKNNYQLNDPKIESQLKYIIGKFEQLKYTRYEVSNWAKNKKSQSLHNLAYWLTQDWKGIGFGAYGLENMNYYAYEGSINDFHKENQLYSNREYYFQILLMGLRLKEGLNLNCEKYQKAYNFFKPQLINVIIDKKNRLRVKNLNTLDDTLIEII